jgi:hypothetical protein
MVMEPTIVLLNCSLDKKDKNNVEFFQNSGLIHEGLGKLSQKRGTQVQVRKFIVLRNDKEVYIVIGPEFDEYNSQDPRFYTHKTLREVALFVLDKDGSHRYQIKGGGKITFLWSTERSSFIANFGGESRDYGTYDPVVLPYSRLIATWLKMVTTFEWRDRREPGNK